MNETQTLAWQMYLAILSANPSIKPGDLDGVTVDSLMEDAHCFLSWSSKWRFE